MRTRYRRGFSALFQPGIALVLSLEALLYTLFFPLLALKDLPPYTAGVLTAIYALGLALGSLIVPRLLARVPPLHLLGGGLLLFTLALLAYLPLTPLALGVGRGLAGFACGILWTVTLPWVQNTPQPGERMGRLMRVLLLLSFLGPALGGVLYEHGVLTPFLLGAAFLSLGMGGFLLLFPFSRTLAPPYPEPLPLNIIRGRTWGILTDLTPPSLWILILLVALGVNTLDPILPYLLKERGVPPPWIGTLITLSWITVALVLPLLGRVADHKGRALLPFLLAGFPSLVLLLHLPGLPGLLSFVVLAEGTLETLHLLVFPLVQTLLPRGRLLPFAVLYNTIYALGMIAGSAVSYGLEGFGYETTLLLLTQPFILYALFFLPWGRLSFSLSYPGLEPLFLGGRMLSQKAPALNPLHIVGPCDYG